MGNASAKAFQAYRLQMRLVRPSPPAVNIYLSNSRGNNQGVIQTVFDYMRSGEWASTIACEELFGIPKSRLYWVINQIRRRGWPVECKRVNIGYTGQKFTQYRLLNWDPV